ncbi:MULTISPECIES: restriction endonuclease subunit S [unclassified Campylobacter]|uniref:restriction endonuclease subunit S n=1 Tax=unclassified Campylobacter TaxID=2593542 RepID=UPI001BD95959|nr:MULTISPECIES: restriction endonuclease subunit S [unclassified Campylobacter]MBT0880690.1 restriction endonuclease subunit S [Campylobacter sp. 2018MI27]MBT0884840.1 restriction endonuclease subunit S [Campylobacter sp. 2018MI10]
MSICWEEVRLGDIGEFLKTYSNSRADLQENDEIFYIHYGDIHTTYDYFLDFATHNPPMINSSKLKSNDLVLLQDGDLVIADASEDYEGIAKSAEVINIGQKRAVAGLHTFLFRADDKYLAKKFRAYFLCSDFVRQQFKKIATGISVLGISKTNIQNIKIKLPLLKEQEKIAEILSSCDEHIKNLKNLKSELEKEKLHLMNELLSGKTRFANFTTPWQEVKFGDILTFASCNSKSKFICDDGKYFIVDMGSVTQDGVLNTSKRTNLEEDFLKIDDLVMPKDDIGKGLIIGKVATIKEDNKYICGDHIYKINTTENPNFIRFLINSCEVNKEIKRVVKGTAQLGLSKKDIEKIKIKLPSLEEQKKIGEVLSACDERLECLNELITAQTTLKSHLLTELLTGNLRVKDFK